MILGANPSGHDQGKLRLAMLGIWTYSRVHHGGVLVWKKVLDSSTVVATKPCAMV